MRSASSFLFVLFILGAVPAGADPMPAPMAPPITPPATAPAAVAGSVLPDPGTRVRLSTRMPAREQAEGARTSVFGSGSASPTFVHSEFTGPFVSAAHDTVTMHDGDMNGALVSVPTLHVTSFEISRGELPNGLRGGCVGLAIGALVGLGQRLYTRQPSI
jgi:hypothetical protein